MQMQSVQSVTEKKNFWDFAPDGISVLTAICHPNESTIAKDVLMTLWRAKHTSWSVEFQDDMMTMHADALHPTYGYRMSIHEFGKGLRQIRMRGLELVERIEAGCQ